MTPKRYFNAVVGDSGGGKVYGKPQIYAHTHIDYYYYCLTVCSICTKMYYNTGINF